MTDTDDKPPVLSPAQAFCMGYKAAHFYGGEFGSLEDMAPEQQAAIEAGASAVIEATPAEHWLRLLAEQIREAPYADAMTAAGGMFAVIAEALLARAGVEPPGKEPPDVKVTCDGDGDDGAATVTVTFGASDGKPPVTVAPDWLGALKGLVGEMLHGIAGQIEDGRQVTREQFTAWALAADVGFGISPEDFGAAPEAATEGGAS